MSPLIFFLYHFLLKISFYLFFYLHRLIKLPAVGFVIIPWTHLLMNMNFWVLHKLWMPALIFKETFQGAVPVVSLVNLLGNQHLPTGTKPLSSTVFHTSMASESFVRLLKHMEAQPQLSSIKIRIFCVWWYPHIYSFFLYFAAINGNHW